MPKLGNEGRNWKLVKYFDLPIPCDLAIPSLKSEFLV